MKKLEYLYAVVKVKWCSYCEEQYSGSSEN